MSLETLKTSKTQSIPGVFKADLQMFESPKDTPMTSSDDHGYGKPAGLLGMGLAGVGMGDYI